MPKYIDADALRKRMEQIAEESKPAATARPMREDTPSELLRYGTARAMIEWINEIPSADVEPVVRCRDCKYKPTAPDGITHGFQVEFPDEWSNRCPCLCEDGWYSWVPDNDFFCAYGAKMDADPTKEEDNGDKL